MAKYKYWQIDNEKKQKEHYFTPLPEAAEKEPLLGLFKFRVIRKKDIGTKREQLEVTAFVEDINYGSILTDLISIEKDMVQFRSNGVVIDRAKNVELCNLITANYYYFDYDEIGNIDAVVTEEIALGVARMLCQYILDNNIQAKQLTSKGRTYSLYHIPIRVFNGEIADSEYRNFSLTEIKEKLKDIGYTFTNQGKFDYVLNDNDQRIKMLSIHEHKVTETMKETSND